MQTGGLLKDLTVRETVRYTASLFADTEAVDEVLANAGITDIADRKVGKCSGGEQQRLRFAMALLPDPALLLLDEPTTGMDVEGRRTFWSAIRADAAQRPHRPVRDPLPRGGRPVRRPDRADQPGPDRRRRHRRRDQGARLRPHRARDASRAPTPIGPGRRSAGVDGVEVRGDTVLIVHAEDTDAVARYLLTRDRRPGPRDHRHGSRGGVPQPDRQRPETRRDRTDEHDRLRPDHPQVPPFGGFNLTVLGIELRRMLRNRRTVIFTLVFPAALFLVVRRQRGLERRRAATATWRRTSWSRWRLYGAALTAAAGGAMVAMERALGWSRQLRLTPLQPGRLHPDEGARRADHGRDRRSRSSTSSASSRASPSMPAERVDRVRRADRGLHAGVRRAGCLRRLSGAR